MIWDRGRAAKEQTRRRAAAWGQLVEAMLLCEWRDSGRSESLSGRQRSVQRLGPPARLRLQAGAAPWMTATWSADFIERHPTMQAALDLCLCPALSLLRLPSSLSPAVALASFAPDQAHPATLFMPCCCVLTRSNAWRCSERESCSGAASPDLGLLSASEDKDSEEADERVLPTYATSVPRCA